MTERNVITQQTRNTQSEIMTERGHLPGACEFSKELARKLHGWVYLTETPSHFGKVHKVAVARFEDTTRGQIIDVTQANPYIGEISNVFDFELTAKEIGVQIGVDGWGLDLNYSI